MCYGVEDKVYSDLYKIYGGNLSLFSEIIADLFGSKDKNKSLSNADSEDSNKRKTVNFEVRIDSETDSKIKEKAEQAI